MQSKITTGRLPGSLPRADTVISDRAVQMLSSFMLDQFGIKLGPQKKSLLQTRLRKRLISLELSSFDEYCDFLSSREGFESEHRHLADVITTHKTDFFREPHHFDYLAQTILPTLAGSAGTGQKSITAWSAGCSTGEEPYTIAMVMQDYGEKYPGLEFSLLASDISGSVIDKARKGIYEGERITPIPLDFRKKYLLRCRDPLKDVYRVMPCLRSRITFRKINFMERSYGINEPFSFIFCRNVLIYFDRIAQEKIINRFASHIIKGGYLFLGHSETISGMDTPFVYEAATIYRKL